MAAFVGLGRSSGIATLCDDSSCQASKESIHYAQVSYKVHKANAFLIPPSSLLSMIRQDSLGVGPPL